MFFPSTNIFFLQFRHFLLINIATTMFMIKCTENLRWSQRAHQSGPHLIRSIHLILLIQIIPSCCCTWLPLLLLLYLLIQICRVSGSVLEFIGVCVVWCLANQTRKHALQVVVIIALLVFSIDCSLIMVIVLSLVHGLDRSCSLLGSLVIYRNLSVMLL